MHLTLAFAALLLSASVQLPDPAKGSIDGKVAVLVWPRLDGQLIEPVDCTAHLIPVTDPDSDLHFACGNWFQPPPATYRIWVEQKNLISPLQNILVYSGNEFRERGLTGIFDVVKGGTVQLPSDVKLAMNQQLRLLHLDSHYRLHTLGRAFERRITAANAHRPLLMPAGPIVAVVTDAQGNALSITRPIAISESATSPARPAAPRRGTDVLAVLDRARTATLEKPDDVQLTLTLADRSVAPDVFVTSADRVYGIWYGVDAPRAVLHVASSTVALPEEELRLKPGSVATIRRKLSVLPSAKISVHVPDGALEGLPRTIEIAAPGKGTVRQFALGGDEAVAESLPVAQLRVVLGIGPWRFLREVDLTSVEEGRVDFDLHPITITGTVYRGREPAAGTVKFYVGKETTSANTSADGRYQIDLWDPSMYVAEVQLRDGGAPPFREYFIDVDHSDTHDFHVPDNHYLAHVTDADTGAPVAGAEVIVTNVFHVPDGREQTTTQGAFSDEQGNATLPALRLGSASLVARAKGYFASEPVSAPVDETSEQHSIALQLRGEGTGDALSLRLPNGAPAANARLMAVPIDADVILWQSSTDDRGRVIVPKSLRGALLLVKHEAAGALVRVWTPSENASWPLPDAAPELLIRATDASGDAVRFAHVIFFVDDFAIHGGALRFLSGSVPMTDRDGVWKATGLGRQRYAVVAMRQYREHVLQSLAQPLTFPWPRDPAVRVLE